MSNKWPNTGRVAALFSRNQKHLRQHTGLNNGSLFLQTFFISINKKIITKGYNYKILFAGRFAVSVREGCIDEVSEANWKKCFENCSRRVTLCIGGGGEFFENI